MTYAVETELSSRVRQWERRIRPILEEEVCPVIIILSNAHRNVIGITGSI